MGDNMVLRAGVNGKKGKAKSFFIKAPKQYGKIY
jgi:hypothetical protein